MSSESPIDELERYAPSGRVGSRFALVAPVALAIAAGLGVGYQRVLDVSPFVVLHVLFPCVLGGLLGLLGIVSVAFGHVRNGHVVVLHALCLTVVALGSAWWIHVADADAPASFRSLWPIAWFFETLFVALLAVALPRAWWRRAVFCEDDRRFLRRKLLGRAWGAELLTLRRAAGAGGIDTLLSLGLRPMAGNDIEGEFRFWLRRGRSGSWLTVWWHGHLESPRGRKLRRDVLVLRRVSVTEEFLRRLSQVLAPE